MPDGEANTKLLAARLQELLAAHAPEDRDSARQDSIDLLALASDLKLVALIGCGYLAGDWLAAVADLAAATGFAVRRGGMPWFVAEEFAGLPDWYAASVRKAWGTADILTVTRPEEAARFAAAPLTLTVAEEAELLFYPDCCVADHHARRRLYHDLMVELIAARCPTEAECRRFVEAELEPPLRDDADHRRLAEALRGEALAAAGFVPCPACTEGGADSQAGLIDRALLEVALETGFPLTVEG